MVLFILLFLGGHWWVIWKLYLQPLSCWRVASQSGCTFPPVACKACPLSLCILANTAVICFLIFVAIFCLFLKCCHWLGELCTMEQPFACRFGCGHPTRLKMGTRTHWLASPEDTEILCVCLRCFSCHCCQIPDKRQQNGDLFCLQFRECCSSWRRKQEWFGLWCWLGLLSFFFFNF